MINALFAAYVRMPSNSFLNVLTIESWCAFIVQFENEKNLGSIDDLVEAAGVAGCDTESARAFLLTDEFAEDIIREERKYRKHYGVTGVPFFIINDEIAVSNRAPPLAHKLTCRSCLALRSRKNS